MILKLNYVFAASSPRPQQSEKNRHECTVCGKRFPTPSKLLRHEVVHSGDKPYACPRCNNKYSQRHAQQLHTQKCTKFNQLYAAAVNWMYRQTWQSLSGLLTYRTGWL